MLFVLIMTTPHAADFPPWYHDQFSLAYLEQFSLASVVTSKTPIQAAVVVTLVVAVVVVLVLVFL